MIIFLFTLIFYNSALFYCYRTNDDFIINLVFTFIFNAAYFYILPDVVDFVKDAERRRKVLMLARGACVASFLAVVGAMLMH